MQKKETVHGRYFTFENCKNNTLLKAHFHLKAVLLRLPTHINIYCGVFLYMLHIDVKAKKGHKELSIQSCSIETIFLSIKSRRLLRRVNKLDLDCNSF